jgi:hypothetical protein
MTADRAIDGETLEFVVSFDDETAAGGEKGIFGRRDDPQLRRIPVAAVRESLRETLSGLRHLFDGVTEAPACLPLKEVQVSFEVTATGKVALIGTGAEVAGKGAITLTFGS